MLKSQEAFIQKILSGAIKAYKEFNILPSLTLAQSCLESAWGRASIGNNVFGIKAGASWTGKKLYIWTTEYVNGKKIKVQAWFRDYNSVEDSVVDHSKLLSLPRYKIVREAKNYKEACVAIQKAGYATDINYTNKLIKLIELHQLYKYDTQQPTVIKKKVSASTLNVRSTNSTDSKVLGKLKNGTIIIVKEIVGGWAKFDYNGVSAFVSAKYLVDA